MADSIGRPWPGLIRVSRKRRSSLADAAATSSCVPIYKSPGKVPWSEADEWPETSLTVLRPREMQIENIGTLAHCMGVIASNGERTFSRTRLEKSLRPNRRQRTISIGRPAMGLLLEWS